MNEAAYPLSWPIGWPRTKSPTTSKFGERGVKPSIDKARRELTAELDRLGGTHAVLSTNLRLRLDGALYTDQKVSDDKGVAIYFTLNKERIALACDKWDRVACNITALARHIESIRGQSRWGVGSVKQAFRSYLALPESINLDAGYSNCWEFLGLTYPATEKQIQEAYIAKAQIMHPDRGGKDQDMSRLNRARDEAIHCVRKS